MQYYEKHIYTSEELKEVITEYKNKGFVLKQDTNTIFYLINHNYGKLKTHVLLMISTIWFSLGIINILYLIISYHIYSKKVIITYIDDKDIDKQNILNSYEGFDDLDIIIDFLEDNKKPSKEDTIIKDADESPIIDFLEYNN